MTLRCCGCDTVPMIGPRACGLAAPQWIGKRDFPPGSGWEVRRMWSVRLDLIKEPVTKRPNCPPAGRPTRMRVAEEQYRMTCVVPDERTRRVSTAPLSEI